MTQGWHGRDDRVFAGADIRSPPATCGGKDELVQCAATVATRIRTLRICPPSGVSHEVGHASARLIVGERLTGDECQDVGADDVAGGPPWCRRDHHSPP